LFSYLLIPDIFQLLDRSKISRQMFHVCAHATAFITHAREIMLYVFGNTRLNAALININKDDIVFEIVIFQLNFMLCFVENRRSSRISSNCWKESEERRVKHVEPLHIIFVRLSKMG